MNPDPKLRNADRLAAAFCAPIRLPFDFDAARALIDADRAGYASYFYVNARSRCIDDLLVRGPRDGVKQVVVLGYRIPVDGSDAAIARAAQAEEKAVARLGEPFRTSWTPAGASAFLRSRGFRVNHDVGVSELRARYLEGTDGKLDGEPMAWYRILDASVH